MKKAYILFVFCLLFTFNGLAQDNAPLLDSIICNEFTTESDSLILYRWLYHYNDEGQVINYEWLERYYSQWKIVEAQQKTYDNTGNLIIQIDNVPRGDWLFYPFVKKEWEYDQHGNPLIRIRHYKNEDQESWIPWDRAEYKHTSDGQLIQLLYFTWSSGIDDWRPNQSYTYT
jgi:hypothetical protein